MLQIVEKKSRSGSSGILFGVVVRIMVVVVVVVVVVGVVVVVVVVVAVAIAMAVVAVIETLGSSLPAGAAIKVVTIIVGISIVAVDSH